MTRRLAGIHFSVLLVAFLIAFVAAKRPWYPPGYNHTAAAAARASGRVVGGQAAEVGFAPYQASLQMYKYHICGACILNKMWVVSAAHCAVAGEAKDFTIITGTNRWDQPGASYAVDEVHIHCSYDTPRMHNDISAMRTSTEIIFNELTQPIALLLEPPEEGTDLLLTGWGSTWSEAEPYDLQKITLKFLSYDKCSAMLPHDAALALGVGHMCTYTKEGEGACYGDSGGPLVVRDKDGVSKLIGLVNWGIPCAEGYPDMYANLLYYHDWVLRTTSGNKKCFAKYYCV